MMRDLFSNPIPDPANTHISFRQWQIREGNVLYRAGTPQMSNTHLLAHLLRNQRTAEQLMEHFGDLGAIAESSVNELKQVKGVGIAVAETIQVAFELSRRRSKSSNGKKPRIYGPKDVFELLREDFLGGKTRSAQSASVRYQEPDRAHCDGVYWYTQLLFDSPARDFQTCNQAKRILDYPLP